MKVRIVESVGNERLTSMWQSRRIVADGKLAWAGHKDILRCSSNAYYPISVNMVSCFVEGPANISTAFTCQPRFLV